MYSPNSSGVASWSVWVNPNTVVLETIASNTSSSHQIMIVNATTIRFKTSTGTNRDFTVPTLVAGRWYYIVLTRSSSDDFNLYLNTVIWAADGLRVEEDGFFQNTPSYGNVIVIQHDFGYRGQALYTLYAHLSGVLVRRGDRVEARDAIGLVGQSGRVFQYRCY